MSSEQIPEDFSEEELDRFMAEALRDNSITEKRGLFAYGDTKLLEDLDSILDQHIEDRAVTQDVLRSLRDRLLEGDRGHIDRETSMRKLHTIVQNCRKCPDVVSEPHLPHWNVIDPDVVFVLDTPLSSSKRAADHFVESLKRSGFSSKRVTATSVIRCYTKGGTPSEEEVANCSSRFLFRELQMLKPQLTVTLGSIATAVTTGIDVKVTEEHGNVFWVGPWPVMVTTSPAYAMRSSYNQDDFQSDLDAAHRFVYG